MVKIRRADLKDLEAITAIYNDAVVNSVATFDTEPRSREEQEKWFSAHDQRYRILVADADSSVAGWAALSRWSDRCAYADTAECSMYIDRQQRGRGVGRELFTALVDEAKTAGLHTLIARIVEGNEASLHLCQSLGFLHIGIMREVGRKFGRLLDVHLLQIIL